MDKLWVKRTNTSTYFPTDFLKLERHSLESIPGIGYLSPDEPIPSEGQLCLLTNTHTRLPEWEALAPRIEFILHPNSGHDNLLTEGDSWNNIPTVLGNTIRARAVSEWVLGCLMQSFTPVIHHSVWPKGRHWDRELICGKRMLVIGHGHVGKHLVPALAALGGHVEVHDPHEGMKAEVLSSWDVVILAASLNQENRHFLNAEFFRHQKENLLLINPARGEFIDEHALRAYLRANPMARAYLDVHAMEPYPQHYWDNCPQVVATPHIAGVWSGLVMEMIKFEVEVLSAWNALPRDEFMQKYQQQLLSYRRTLQGWYR